MKRALLVIVPVVLLASGAAAWWLTRSEGAPTDSREHVVRRGSLTETAAATGTIEPRVQLEVKSRASGEVVEVLVQEGEVVEAGALLVRLDPADAERAVRESQVAERRALAELAQARASLAVAGAEAGEAGANEAVQEEGAGLGIVSREVRRTASHASRVATSNVALRRAQVASAQAALEAARLGVEEAERRLRETQIRASMAGTVLSVAVERGSIVSSAVTTVSGGTTLLTVADLSALRVIGAIDEAQIGRVAVDQAVTIRVDAYPEQTFSGRVERVSPLGVRETNVVTFGVDIAITDDEVALLRSGMSADLEIVTADRDAVLLIPLVAVHSRGAARFVRLGSGEEREIRTGATDGSVLEVLDGLEEGDRLDLSVRGARGRPRDRQQSPLPMGGRPSGGGRRS